MATLPYNSTIYKDTLTPVTCTIQAGETTSSILKCIESSIGTGTLVALKMPSGFTASDLTFLDVDLKGVDPDMTCTVTDGFTNTVPINFKNVTQLKKITYPPFFFYGCNAIKIVTSNPQVNTVVITGLLQPITQGAA